MTRPARASALVLALTITIAFTIAVPAFAQVAGDWNQFQGGAPHPGNAAGPEPGFREAWTTPVEPGGPGDRFGLSAPVFAGDLVIAVGPEQVVALETATGEQAWTLEKVLGPSVPGAVVSIDGGDAFVFTEGWGEGPLDVPTTGVASPTPSVSPTPDLSQTQDEDEVTQPAIVAVSLQDRSELWRAELPEVSRSGVTVLEDTVLVGTNDGSVNAFDLVSGESRWNVDIGLAVDVAVAAGGDLVVASARGNADIGPAVVGLALADGAERWRFAPATPAPFTGPATIAHDAAFVGFADRKVYAIETSDGTERWSATLNGAAPLSPITVTSDAVIVVDVGTFGSQVTAFDPASGARRWDHPLGVSVLRAAPLALGRYIVTGAVDGSVWAFDGSNGDLVWLRGGAGPVRSLASDGDTLIAVRAQPAGVTAYVNDPGEVLVAVQTPTSVKPGFLAAWWAAASLVVGAAAFGLGHLLIRRLGPPAFPDEDEDVDLDVEAT